ILSGITLSLYLAASILSFTTNAYAYECRGHSYTLLSTAKGYDVKGIASWYGTEEQGGPTASGKPYNMYLMTAAHKTLPLYTYVEVSNLDNGKHTVVQITDRGPYVSGRVIDLSYAAAK